MALNTFGWTPAEVTQDSAGNVVAGVTLTVFTDISKATQVTGLFDKDGVTPLANNVVVSDTKGRFGFKAPDTYSLLYVYDGSTADPWPVASHEALRGSAYTPANPTLSVSYNPDGTVSSTTENGVTTSFTYNADGTVNTQTRAGVTRTFTYSNGNVTGAA